MLESMNVVVDVRLVVFVMVVLLIGSALKVKIFEWLTYMAGVAIVIFALMFALVGGEAHFVWSNEAARLARLK